MISKNHATSQIKFLLEAEAVSKQVTQARSSSYRAHQCRLYCLKTRISAKNNAKKRVSREEQQDDYPSRIRLARSRRKPYENKAARRSIIRARWCRAPGTEPCSTTCSRSADSGDPGGAAPSSRPRGPGSTHPGRRRRRRRRCPPRPPPGPPRGSFRPRRTCRGAERCLLTRK